MSDMSEKQATEEPVCFNVAGELAIGIRSVGVAHYDLGAIIVVGGPQYRVGSHRQFTLLARAVARAGFDVLRFDCRGMGDSEGAQRTFEEIGEDIRGAVDALVASAGVRRVALWGLCDAASAALMYAPSDTRVASLILANPWVHTEQTEARARLRTYYVSRLRSRDFWSKLLKFDLDLKNSIASLSRYLRSAGGRGCAASSPTRFVDRMLEGIKAFRGPVYLVLSGNDLTANEFVELTRNSGDWTVQLERTVRDRLVLDEANHTFARSEWRGQVERSTIRWMQDVERNGRADT